MALMKATRPTVLHIDDDPNDVMLFEHACRKAGIEFNLQAVHDGDEAMNYLGGANQFSDRAQHPFPHLVLLDLKMPRVNGFDVLTWIRSRDEFKNLPIVILTSSNHETDVKRAYSLGANSYLVKPVGFDALVELARTIQEYWNNLPVS
jgi:CheY-like chemotaxis protein